MDAILAHPIMRGFALIALGIATIILSATNNIAAESAGYVIYKDSSNDPDTFVRIVEVSSYEHFGAISKAITMNGQTMEFFGGQKAIYAPAPGYYPASPEKMIPWINSKIAQFPRCKTQLTALRASWEKLAASNKAASVEATSTAEVVEEVKVFTTKSGKSFTDVTIYSAGDESVKIMHSAGITEINVSDFPGNLDQFQGTFKATLEKIAQARVRAIKRAEENAKKVAKSREKRDKNIEKEFSERIEAAKATLEELEASAESLRTRRDALSLKIGNVISFVVVQKLSSDKFPILVDTTIARYEIRAGRDTAILATVTTEYLSSGASSMSVVKVDEVDVELQNGFERKVPVLKEIDPSLLSEFQLIQQSLFRIDELNREISKLPEEKRKCIAAAKTLDEYLDRRFRLCSRGAEFKTRESSLSDAEFDSFKELFYNADYRALFNKLEPESENSANFLSNEEVEKVIKKLDPTTKPA